MPPRPPSQWQAENGKRQFQTPCAKHLRSKSIMRRSRLGGVAGRNYLNASVFRRKYRWKFCDGLSQHTHFFKRPVNEDRFTVDVASRNHAPRATVVRGAAVIAQHK